MGVFFIISSPDDIINAAIENTITAMRINIINAVTLFGIANEFNLFSSGKNIIKRKNTIKNGKIRTLPNEML